MTHQAESPEIVEVALAATLGHRQNVIGVPEGTSCSDAANSPHFERLFACSAAAPSQRTVGSDGVHFAECASTAIACKDLIAQISGIGAQPPLMHTVVRAERAAARGENLQLAPAAQRPAVWSECKRMSPGRAGFGQGSRGTPHFSRLAGRHDHLATATTKLVLAVVLPLVPVTVTT